MVKYSLVREAVLQKIHHVSLAMNQNVWLRLEKTLKSTTAAHFADERFCVISYLVQTVNMVDSVILWVASLFLVL